MKVIWEAKDLFAGRRIQKPDVGITGSHIVGYDVNIASSMHWGIVSMADGMFQHIGSLESVAAHLNQAGHYVPAEVCPKQWMKDRLDG